MTAKGVAYLKRNGVQGFCRRLVRKAALSRPVDYEKWQSSRRASKKELEQQRQHVFAAPVTFGVCVLTEPGEERLKEQTLLSLKRQSYQKYVLMDAADTGENWKTDGDYLLILRAGVTLEAEMLYRFAEAVERHPQTELLYADHDFFVEGERLKKDADPGRCRTEDPQCKPSFDPYYLRSRNYIGEAFAVSKELAKKGGLQTAMEKKESVYSFLLRCAEQTENVVRIPRILSHQRRKAGNQEEDIRSLQLHYERLGIRAKVSDTEAADTYVTEYVYENDPKVSVIIPNKDNPQQLKTCVESVIRMSGYENLEILIVENNSQEQETFRCYESLKKEDSRIRVLEWKGVFQYSRINNDAVKEAKGEYLLFLNNDTKVKKEGFLAALMNIGRRPDVGAVGAGLYYEDGTIQHAGVILGYGGVAGHALEGMAKEKYESYPFALAQRQLSAVTAACMLVKRQAFQKVGGFSEELAIAYNDIDLCMNLRKQGWKVIYCPQAELYHYESQTRGLEMTKEKAERVKREQLTFQQNWRRELEEGDPFYSPSLTLELSDYSLER